METATIFPEHATPLTWEMIGWNDAAATWNAILESKRMVNSRLARYQSNLETVLSDIDRCNHAWYAMGIEACLLYTNEHPLLAIPPAEIVIVAEDYQSQHNGDACDRCGISMTSGIYVTGLVLRHHYLCSWECASLQRDAEIKADLWATKLYPPGRMDKRRADVPLAEEYTRLESFLKSLPFRTGFDVSTEPPPFQPANILKKLRSA